MDPTVFIDARTPTEKPCRTDPKTDPTIGFPHLHEISRVFFLTIFHQHQDMVFVAFSFGISGARSILMITK